MNDGPHTKCKSRKALKRSKGKQIYLRDIVKSQNMVRESRTWEHITSNSNTYQVPIPYPNCIKIAEQLVNALRQL